MQDVVTRAISALDRRYNDPKATHPDNEAAFILARYLQSEDIALQDAQPYADEFHRISHERDLLMFSDGEEIDRFTFDDQLENAWPKVKVKLGKIYELALKQAKANGIPLEAKEIPDIGAQQLAAVCRELQKCHGSKPFFISQPDAGNVIGMGKRAGAARLSALIKYGIIKLHRKGHSSLASEYYYLPKAERS